MMHSRNRWLVVSTLIVAICAIGFFLRHDLLDFAGAGPAARQKGLEDGRKDQNGRKDQARNDGSRAERERIAKHNEMLERLDKEATAALKKSIAASLSKPPPTISITSGGDVSLSVIASLSLSASEVVSLKTVVSETRSKEAKMFAERSELIPGTVEQDGASFQYLVRAKRDRGAADMNQLSEKVGQILDDPRSKQFMGGVGEFDFYGGFGRYDVEVTFYSENGVDMVKYQYLEPSSGKPTRFGVGRLDDPNYSDWKMLNLPKH